MTHRAHGGTLRTAHELVQDHGPYSAGLAADHADEHFTNLDVGGFAYWKSVEKLIRGGIARDAA
ncbi:MAG: hypothetical protein IPK66_13615 [Rhodospirillales bacterium]|nr:hypothetical protein [Rhodospirillales bacterium]